MTGKISISLESFLRSIDVLTERCDRDLSADVAELGDEAENHVVLLVQRSVHDGVSVLVDSELEGRVVNNGARADSRLLDLRQFGEEEEDGHSGSSTCYSKVHILYIGELVLRLASEEGLRGDQRANEAGDTVLILR